MQDTVVEKEKDKHKCIQHHVFSLKGNGKKKISRTAMHLDILHPLVNTHRKVNYMTRYVQRRHYFVLFLFSYHGKWFLVQLAKVSFLFRWLFLTWDEYWYKYLGGEWHDQVSLQSLMFRLHYPIGEVEIPYPLGFRLIVLLCFLSSHFSGDKTSNRIF